MAEQTLHRHVKSTWALFVDQCHALHISHSCPRIGWKETETDKSSLWHGQLDSLQFLFILSRAIVDDCPCGVIALALLSQARKLPTQCAIGHEPTSK